VVREGFADPADKLACHRLAVLQPNSSSSHFSPASPGDYDDLTEMVEDFDGSSVGIGSTAGIGSSWLGQLTITHVVSQSDILRFLHTHRQRLGQALLGSSLAQARKRDLVGCWQLAVACGLSGWGPGAGLPPCDCPRPPAPAVLALLTISSRPAPC
jgi:hypothetical protein